MKKFFFFLVVLFSLTSLIPAQTVTHKLHGKFDASNAPWYEYTIYYFDSTGTVLEWTNTDTGNWLCFGRYEITDSLLKINYLKVPDFICDTTNFKLKITNDYTNESDSIKYIIGVFPSQTIEFYNKYKIYLSDTTGNIIIDSYGDTTCFSFNSAGLCEIYLEKKIIPINILLKLNDTKHYLGRINDTKSKEMTVSIFNYSTPHDSIRYHEVEIKSITDSSYSLFDSDWLLYRKIK